MKKPREDDDKESNPIMVKLMTKRANGARTGKLGGKEEGTQGLDFVGLKQGQKDIHARK